VQDRVTRSIGGVTGAGKPCAAERTLSDAASRITTEDDPYSFQIQDIAGRFATHDLNRILIAKILTALRRIEGMGFPGVIFTERGIDTALRGD
jgi:hypothetical protein